MSDLYKKSQKEFTKQLGTELGITNVMAVPKLNKIVVNIGLGEALVNKKAIDTMLTQLASITGQKPIITLAKHDISAFKLRRGDKIGLKVTLRGRRMCDFLEKLIKIVLPRIRDFRGASSNGFDGRGSFTLGLREQIVFPEIEYSQIDKIRGLEITFVTTGEDKKQTKRLLEILGIPFTRPTGRVESSIKK